MLTFAISAIIGVILLSFGLLDTFPQIKTGKQLFIWVALVLLSIPVFAVLSMAVR